MLHLTTRLTASLTALLIAGTAWAQSLFLDHHKAVYDSINNRWLCSVPQSLFGDDWTTTVAMDSTWSEVTIGGSAVTDGDSVTFEALQGGKLYPVQAQVNGQALEGHLTFTWLPLIELEGEFGDEYTSGLVSLHMPDTTDTKLDMLAKLKWRGGITNTAGKHKRNYHIKFVDENGDKKNRRLLGLRKDNHWKLDGGQIDQLRIRNRVCTDLWLDMSRDPWHKEIDSTVVNGSRGRVTEVFLNGTYHGIYGLIEPIDRKQLALIKHDEINNEFHGQQWVAKTYAATWRLPAYNNNSSTWNGNEISYPDIEEVYPTDWSTLYNAFEFARKCDSVDDYETLADSLGYYFDIPVMEDYFIFLITLQALDNETKNIYYSCYDKAEGAPRLTITPWDLDISLGAKSLPYLTSNFVRPTRPLDWINNVPLGDMFLHSAPHRKEIIDRYWELRETWLDTEALVDRFQRAVDELEECGAAGREEARWSQDSDLSGKVLDISAEMEYVDNWIRQRMAYLDENVFVRETAPYGDINGDGRVDVGDVTALISIVLNGASGYEGNADLNDDDHIDVGDVTILIGIVLGS